MPRRRPPWCAILFLVLLVVRTAPSACATVRRNQWASSLPDRRPAPVLLEALVTDNPALQLDGPLSQAVEALAEGHAVLRAGGDRKAALLVLLASSGKGKTRFLFELNRVLQRENRTMCIPITFNGRQSLEQDGDAVEALTTRPRARAIVHVALRLLQSTFQINDLGRFAGSFCTSLQAANVPLTPTLLCDVLAQCVLPDVKNVTILVDESGCLPKLLQMPRGDADEFSALRSFSGPSTVNSLGFSVMLMQAGLGDFAEQIVSSRDVKVIVLPEQEIEEALNNWVLHTEESKETVQGWANSVATACQDNLKAKANETELYNKLVLKPLVVECAPLARALEYLSEAVKQSNIQIPSDSIQTFAKLGSTIRRVGQELRNLVDQKLKTRYSSVADRLSPAVLAPAILPSHRLRVSLKQEIGGHRVSQLLSEAAYANALEELDDSTTFIPKIVAAFLRQAAHWQPHLQHLQAWWVELEAVLEAQASGTANAGKLLDVGVRVWSYTILLALSHFQPTLKVTLADIFPACVAHNGLETQNYKHDFLCPATSLW